MIWLLLWLYVTGYWLSGLTVHLSARVEGTPEIKGWQKVLLCLFWPWFWGGMLIYVLVKAVVLEIKGRS